MNDVATIVWTIAGSDSGGGAGIQADLHTFQNFHVHGCSVITAVTAQNSVDVENIAYIPTETIAAQLNVLNSDLPAKACKLGMLGSVAVIQTVADFLKQYNGMVICDPVMIASSGGSLADPNAKEKLIQAVFPHVDLLTPNIFEAEQITQRTLQTPVDVEVAARDILTLGPKSVLIKGGHKQDKYCSDYWSDGKESFWLNSPRLSNPNTHGTGCTLSAAITANLALGYSLKDALVISKMYVTQGIKYATALGKGAGPVSHFFYNFLDSRLRKNDKIDFPTLTHHPQQTTEFNFPSCGHEPLGLYPIVDSIYWLGKLLPLGISTIQLRIKNNTGKLLENEIKNSITLAKQYNARLFINDHWDLAIRFGAYGIHLGQEDLSSADLQKIQQAGLRLGISTHCHYEVARAHAFNPSYIACGPIFTTTSKAMRFPPQGVEKLKYWQAILDYPLVAIGGIGSNEFAAVSATGVSGIAMISAITESSDPITVVNQFLN